jgi:signal transduction histidine kinase
MPGYRDRGTGAPAGERTPGVGAAAYRTTMTADRLRPRRADVVLAAVLAAVMVGATAIAAQHQPERRPFGFLAVTLIVLSAAALAWRSTRPVGALVGTIVPIWIYWAANFPGGPVFLAQLVALVTVIWTGRRAIAWTALAAGFVGFGFLAPAIAGEQRPTLAGALALAAWLLLLGTVSEVVRARRERAAEAARTRAEEERRRASERRIAIARELHDVLAHHISLINVQAGVALHLLDERPEQARTALAAIKEASRESLGELRSVLELLRHGDEAAPRAPAPGLEALDGLAERTSAAGVPVTVDVDGEPRPVPAAVGLAAYRIVQEALTNVTRNARGAAATVRISYAPTELAVQISDDGRGVGAAPGIGTGSGLVGMAERAAALGGEVDAGPRPGGGFTVRARLPLPEARGDGRVPEETGMHA